MSTVRLYLGSSWSETEVGCLVDGSLEVGHGTGTVYPAHVGTEEVVYLGAKWTYGPAQTVLGRWNARERTVSEGLSRYGDAIGSWDERGAVYGGQQCGLERIGRCDPPSGAGAACLLLVRRRRAA